MKHELDVSLETEDPRIAFDLVSDWSEFRDAGLPSSVWDGGDKLLPVDWKSIREASGPLGAAAAWDGPGNGLLKQVRVDRRRDYASFVLPEFFERVSEALVRVAPLPFRLAQFGQLFADWPKPIDGHKRWGIHIDHGWGMLFRGAGHDRLVSRRWLDFGPWRVVHLPDDTTFIQFHDLSLTDPAAAWEQAKVGHQRMGIDPIGGYIKGIDLEVISQLRGLYIAATRTLEIVVGPGNSVSQQDMRVSCALRLHHREIKPASDRIEHIAYVFMDRRDAEAHLHELWLRELQCWYVDERGKHRLDDNYCPTPTPPPWVVNLKGDANVVR